MAEEIRFDRLKAESIQKIYETNEPIPSCTRKEEAPWQSPF
jgi:hypothetical protein